jgi:hypothetical protein
VIFIREAAARPAYDGDVQLAQRGDDVIAQAAGIRDRRALSHPDPCFDAMPQVFRKLSVDVPVDQRARLVAMDRPR